MSKKSTPGHAPLPPHIPEGLESPLSYAVQQRDAKVLDTVKRAVKHGEAMLAFQPVVEAARTNHVAFYEGLIRIQDADGRIIPAAHFMPLVEDLSLGREIDCLALSKGLNTLKTVPGLRLSINMSARSIGYPKWTRLLDQSLQQDPSIAERLILEITEGSAITVPELVNAFMSDLRTRGVAFALDDFGAGATSFRYLRDFRFDMVKIDQQFCRDVHKNLDDQALVRAMLLIAQQFEMMTIAEGVENPDAATWLSNSGLHCLQGYFFAMPQLKPSWTLQAPSGATA